MRTIIAALGTSLALSSNVGLVQACEAGTCMNETDCTIFCDCVPCRSGHYCILDWEFMTVLNSDQPCEKVEQPCAAGSYQPEPGQWRQEGLFHYWHTPTPGSIECEPGKYSKEGAAECRSCPEKQTTKMGATQCCDDHEVDDDYDGPCGHDDPYWVCDPPGCWDKGVHRLFQFALGAFFTWFVTSEAGQAFFECCGETGDILDVSG